jgi:TP901 family phage tail tape measure protein
MIGGGIQKITVEIGGKVAASLAASVRAAQMQVSTFGRNVSRTMNDAAISGKKGFKGIFDNSMWQQATIGATAFAGAIGLSVKAAMEFDKAMADVRKAIDFKDGEKGIKRFGNQLIKLSTELPYTAAQLSQIAASAGFAGYKESEIIPFTRAAARMGVAFQMTAEQAGDAMVSLRASMGLTQPEVENLGDAINYLSDQFQGTVSASDLTEVTRRIGAIGKAAGLTAEQTAGMSAAFLASGTPAEVAATGLKNFLNALTKGEMATANQGYALATLFGGEGLASTIKKGKGKAKKAAKGAAVDIAEELAKGMQIDPEGTIKSVLEKMAKLPKEKQVSIAGALFGEESKQAIMPLLTNTKLIGQAFDLIRDKQAFAGSMQKEFANQMGTSSAQMKIFQNGINAVGVSIGAAILPSLNSILKAVTPVLVRFAEWTQNNQGLATGIVLVGGALSGLIIVLPIIAGVVSAIGTIGAAIGAVMTSVPLLAGIGTVFALVVPPIGLAAAAIAGVAALAFVVIRNWQPISGFFSRLWNQIVATAQSIGPRLLGIFAPIPTAIIRIFTSSSIGQQIISSIINGLKARAGALFGWISSTIGRIRSMMNFGAPAAPGGGGAAAGPAPAEDAPEGRARGGRVRAGTPYLVGERRPELFVPGMNGGIIPRIAQPITGAALAALLASPAAAAAPPPPAVTINAPITINATGGDPQQIRQHVVDAFAEIQHNLAASHRVLLND